MGNHFKDKFTVVKKLGSGSFGDIFLGTDVTSGQQVALKVESNHAVSPQLLYEMKVYRLIQSGDHVGLPKIHWFGECAGNLILVMDLLGPNLEELFDFCDRQFSLKTVLMLADQLIARLEILHENGFVHRDVKPDNFLMGLHKQAKQVFMIDLGLCKRYWNRETASHVPFTDGKTLTGTARYASVNALRGHEQSRRDDLLSLGYMFIYFLKGSLPWQNCHGETKSEKYRNIAEAKSSTSFKDLCNQCPEAFLKFFDYCDLLKFHHKPDYTYLRMLFRYLYAQEDFAYDGFFDWTLKNRNSTHERLS